MKTISSNRLARQEEEAKLVQNSNTSLESAACMENTINSKKNSFHLPFNINTWPYQLRLSLEWGETHETLGAWFIRPALHISSRMRWFTWRSDFFFAPKIHKKIRYKCLQYIWLDEFHPWNLIFQRYSLFGHCKQCILYNHHPWGEKNLLSASASLL